MPRREKALTDKVKKDVLNLLYRTELREGERIIDNSTKSIAKDLHIPVNTVSLVLRYHLVDYYEKLNRRVNEYN